MLGVDIMEKNMDYQYSSYYPYDGSFDPSMQDPMINPMMQYEQAYMYYRYLTMQLEYKMKSIEYEKMTKQNSRSERRVE